MTVNASRTILPRLDERLLATLPVLSKLEPEQIHDLISLATLHSYDIGATVFEEQAPAERFFLLLDGHIRVVRVTEAGEQVITMHIPTGELFGIGKALGHKLYPATAVAAAEVLCLSWPTRLWDDFATRYDGFATETYRHVGGRLGEMTARIVELSTQHVEQRVARAILRLIDQSGRATERGVEIGFPITRQDISEMTGTTLHTVSRLLSAWEKKGVVESGRKRIVVCDTEKLAQIGNAPDV